MGRPKGGKNRKWTPEEKERIVLRYLNSSSSRSAICKEEHITDQMLHTWVNKYQAGGIDALVNQTGKRGNPYAALHTAKDLPEIKRLQLQVAKLEADVERLKKGYVVKGDGAKKEFAPTKGSNSK